MAKKSTKEKFKEIVKLLAQSDSVAKKMSEKLDDSLVELLIPGSYYLRPHPIVKNKAIFGKILFPTDELDKNLLKANENIRLVKAYSVDCINGEVGTEYVSNIIPITVELFEYAKSEKWKISAKDALQFVLFLARAESGDTPKGSA